MGKGGALDDNGSVTPGMEGIKGGKPSDCTGNTRPAAMAS